MWQDNDYRNPNPFKTASDARERAESARITKQKILLGEAILKKAAEAWTKIEEMNEKIKLTEDDMLKSSLRREKNLFAEQMQKYVSDGYNDVCNVVNSKDFMDYKVKFMQSVENDMDLMKKHYGHFSYRNPDTHESENEMLLEVRSLYKDLKEKIKQELVGKNVDEEFIAKTWQYISDNYEKHEQKCKAHEAQVIKLQETVMMCGVWRYGTNPPKSFTDAKPLVDKLNQHHTIGLSNLKFNSDRLVKQCIAEGLKLSGQLPEESSIILEIKSTYESLEEKINKTLDDKINDENIKEEVKNQVWQMPFYSSKYDQLLNKLKTHKQVVKEYEESIIKCDSLYEAHSLNRALEKKHEETMDELNFHINQVIKHFVTKALQITGQPLEESPVMSDIKSILDGFKEKINKNLNDNNINEKIKSDVWKLFCSKYDQHLEKLKLVEKSAKQYEDQLLMCDNFQKAKSITNNLKGIQKKIDSWKLESNNLIEEITNKAIEFSYQAPHLQSTPQIPPSADQQIDLPIVQEAEEEVEIVEEAQVVNLDQAPPQPPPQPELLQPVQQPLVQPQPLPVVMTPEQMMALIQQLQSENTAKNAEIQEKNNVLIEKNLRIQELEQQPAVLNPPIDPDKWILRTEVEEMIDQYKENVQTVEAREKEKDEVIQKMNEDNLQKDLVIAQKDRVIETVSDKLDIALERNIEYQATVKDLRQDKIDLRADKEEWKFKAEKEKEIAQKLNQDLTIKDTEIDLLKQQLVTFQHPLDNLDDLDNFVNINPESSGVSTIGNV